MRARRERAAGCALERGGWARVETRPTRLCPPTWISRCPKILGQLERESTDGGFIRSFFFSGLPRSPHPRARVPRRDDGDHARDAGGVGVGVEPPARASPRTARRPRVRARTRFEATPGREKLRRGGPKAPRGPRARDAVARRGRFLRRARRRRRRRRHERRRDGPPPQPRRRRARATTPPPLPPGRGGETDATSTGRTRPGHALAGPRPEPGEAATRPDPRRPRGGLPAGGARTPARGPSFPFGTPLAAATPSPPPPHQPRPRPPLPPRRRAPGPNAPAAAPPTAPATSRPRSRASSSEAPPRGERSGNTQPPERADPPAGGKIKIIKSPPLPRPSAARSVSRLLLRTRPRSCARRTRPGTSPRTSRGERPRSRSSAATRRRSRRGLSTSSPSSPRRRRGTRTRTIRRILKTIATAPTTTAPTIPRDAARAPPRHPPRRSIIRLPRRRARPRSRARWRRSGSPRRRFSAPPPPRRRGADAGGGGGLGEGGVGGAAAGTPAPASVEDVQGHPPRSRGGRRRDDPRRRARR